MGKRRIDAVALYLVGIAATACGIAFLTRADFGLSMVGAPVYIIYRKASEYVSFLTYGTVTYLVEGVLIVITAVIMKRFRLYYLFSFLTAVFSGFMIDFFMWSLPHVTEEMFFVRILCFTAGMLLCAFGITLLFHTYFAPEAYELFVKEVSAKTGMEISRFKIRFDFTFLMIAFVLSFAFFGLFHFVGIGIGTVICAFCNGRLIGWFSRCLKRNFQVTDVLKLKKYFVS